MGLPLHLKFTARTDLCPHIKYLQPQGASQWLFALSTLFIAGVNCQDLPQCITFSLTCFFPEDPRLGALQNTRSFPTAQEARSPWRKHQLIQTLVRTLFLACRWPPSCHVLTWPLGTKREITFSPLLQGHQPEGIRILAL